ncbi:MAG: peptidoglycan DD-metalloendopeptidase family protein [Bacillota bacterium]|nr:peptidoglycan DD-metalloendopeptidase family protein [Bacillota bacterium]
MEARPAMKDRKTARWAASALVAWLAVSGLGLPARAARAPDPGAIERQMNAAQDQLRAHQAQAAQTRNELATVQSQAASAQAKLHALSSQLRAARSELGRRQRELAEAQGRLRQLQAELAANKARLARQQEQLGAGLRLTYEQGVVSWLDVLLGARDFRDFVTRFQELSQIVRENVRLLRRVQAERRLIARQAAAQERQVAVVARLTRQVAAVEQVLATRTAQQHVVYASYRQAASQLQAAYDQEQQASQQIQAQLARLQRQYEAARAAQLAALRAQAAAAASARGQAGAGGGGGSDGAGSSGGGGGWSPGAANPRTGLAWPLSSFVVTRPFGENYDPVLKQVRMHTGIDLAAPEGTPVHAAGPGIVFYAGWQNGYGNTVILVHGNGLSTLYAHLSAILVSQGQAVEAGQVIGRVGETGWATGPHLHFEVRVDGAPVSPGNYVGG